MPKYQNKSTGKIGEDLAAAYLTNKGFQILDRNWGNKWGEIDIIAKDKNTIVFVEVKTKIGTVFGTPEEMINQKKLLQIQKIASIHPLSRNNPLRIDVIAIILKLDRSLRTLNHYRSVIS